MDWFILEDDGTVKPVTMKVASKWGAANPGKRRIDHTVFFGIRISTVFLTLNHQYGSGPPLVFETCVFYPEDSRVKARYETKKEAEKGHKEIAADEIKKYKDELKYRFIKGFEDGIFNRF